MKHLIFRRGMLPFIAVLFSFFMVISCQQDDLTSTLSTPTETITSGDSGLKTSDLFTFEPESYDNAFAGIATTRDGLTNYPSADIIQDIYNLIMIENEEHDFVDHLVNTHGLPEWNFSIMKGDANGDYVVSIPFVVDPISNVIDGVLKYYHSPNEQVITFATKDGADDMLVTPINELNLDYATGILFDFSIFE